jgi:hypothetical protein
MLEPASCTAPQCRRAKPALRLLVLFLALGGCSTEGGGQTGDEGKHSGGEVPSPGGRSGSTSGGSAGNTSGASAVQAGMGGALGGSTNGSSGAGVAGSAAGGASNTECATACGSFSCCDGSCVNQDNDIDNCGGCGIRCVGDTPFCNHGTCAAPPCTLVGAACLVGETCCVDQCCGTGELCCNVHENVLRTGCYPAVKGTCPVGCPQCD